MAPYKTFDCHHHHTLYPKDTNISVPTQRTQSGDVSRGSVYIIYCKSRDRVHRKLLYCDVVCLRLGEKAVHVVIVSVTCYNTIANEATYFIRVTRLVSVKFKG